MTPVNDAARQYEEDARKEIAAWENQQPNALQSAGQKVSESLSRVAGPLGALVPKRVVNAVTEAVEKALLGMGDLVGKTVNAQSINDQRAKVREESCCDLEACDRLAQKSAALHITAAGVEGAALGAGGLASSPQTSRRSWRCPCAPSTTSPRRMATRSTTTANGSS